MKLELLKTVAGLIVSSSATKVASTALKTAINLGDDMGKLKKLYLQIGIYGISGAVGTAAAAFVVKEIDEMAEFVNEIKAIRDGVEESNDGSEGDSIDDPDGETEYEMINVKDPKSGSIFIDYQEVPKKQGSIFIDYEEVPNKKEGDIDNVEH